MKKALIFGITGQDGSYLTEFLLEKGYVVHGVVRRSSTPNLSRIEHMRNPRVTLHYGDLSDGMTISRLVREISPDEIYNLGAQSQVKVSFEVPEYTTDITGVGCLRILEAIRAHNPKIKYYQASSSEMFGKVAEIPQKETTPFHPRSPYGCAKVFAYWIARNYRESYGLFACNGILFNHESPRRGEEFVTRKITRGMIGIQKGTQKTLELGNLDAKRDWGYAKDYVEGMWMMLQQKGADDYVLATNETHTVREFVEETARLLDISLAWKGKGLKEKGIDKKTRKTIVEINPAFFRPAEVEILIGDYSKAKKKLGWKPKVTFKQLVKLMVQGDLQE